MIALVTQAYELAARSHAGQVRKDITRTPHIVHPCAVARAGADMQTVLHDTADDADVTPDDIRKGCGDRVTLPVAAVTSDPGRKAARATHTGSAGLCELRDIAANPTARAHDRATACITGARAALTSLEAA